MLSTSRAARDPVTAHSGKRHVTVPRRLAAAAMRDARLAAHDAVGGRGALRLLQRKLIIDPPGSVWEREADAVADRVSMDVSPAPVPASAVTPPQPALLRRACTGCAHGAPCAACADEDDGLLERRAGSAPDPSSLAVPDDYVRRLGAGEPLDPGAREFFEPRLGIALGDVRVHYDPAAADSAGGVNALAYTSGRDVVFGAGQFAPHTTAGRRLLAHELTHVRQQSTSTPHVQRQPEPGESTFSEAPAEEAAEPPSAVTEPAAACEPGIICEPRAAGGPPLPADVAQAISYAAIVLRRVTPLSEEDRADLDRIIPGSALFERIKRRDEKQRQLGRIQDSISAYGRTEGLPFAESEMVTLSDYAGPLAAEVEKLDAEIQAELAQLGTDEQGLVKLLEERFPEIWEERTKQIAYAMLDENKEVVEYERERYSREVCSPDTIGLQEADGRLAEAYVSPAEEDALDRAAAYRGTIPAGAEPRTADELGIPEGESSLIVIIYNFDEYRTSIEQRKAKPEAERAALIPEFPILGARGYIPGVFADTPEDELGKVVGEPIDEILENIEDTRGNIEDDTIRVWDLERVPGLAFRDLGVPRDSVLGDAVESYIKDKESDEHWLDIALAALAVVATVVATFATGGLALAAWGVALAASGASLYRSTSRYMAESAAEYVALDPTIADISKNEPELLWVVLDAVGLGLDVGDVLKLIRPAARSFMATRDIAAFTDEVQQLSPELADRLVRSARSQLLERSGREAASEATSEADLIAGAAGNAGRNLTPDELDAELRAVLRSEPEQLAAGGEYVMEVAVPNSPHRWRLRRDGVWCRFSNGDLCLIPSAVPPKLRAIAVEGGRVSAARARRVLSALQDEFPILRQFPLDLHAVQRVLAKGPLVDRMKGQLLEELLAVRVRQALRTRTGRAAFGLGQEEGELVFIEGWRITGADGRQLTDGIIAARRGDRLEVKLVLEAKSGAGSAEGLARHVERVRSMARAQRLELFREIREAYRNALEDYIRTTYPESVAAYQARSSLEAATRTSSVHEFEALPFSALPEDLIIDVATHPRFRRGEQGRILTTGQGGQVTRDIERIAEGGKVYVDGNPVAVTAGPQSTRFTGALPEDVDSAFIEKSLADLGYNVDVMCLPISAEDIVNLTTELAARISAVAE